MPFQTKEHNIPLKTEPYHLELALNYDPNVTGAVEHLSHNVTYSIEVAGIRRNRNAALLGKLLSHLHKFSNSPADEHGRGYVEILVHPGRRSQRSSLSSRSEPVGHAVTVSVGLNHTFSKPTKTTSGVPHDNRLSSYTRYTFNAHDKLVRSAIVTAVKALKLKAKVTVYREDRAYNLSNL